MHQLKKMFSPVFEIHYMLLSLFIYTKSIKIHFLPNILGMYRYIFNPNNKFYYKNKKAYFSPFKLQHSLTIFLFSIFITHLL